MRTATLYLFALVCVPPFLLLAVPVALLTALEHRSLRKVLFAQERVGLRGRTFVLLKFRTMIDDPQDPSNSPVVGRFGRILRNTHLDELPQLLNVLKGDMCLVGPRPEMVELHAWAVEQLPAFAERLAIRPGITGRAQIVQGYADGGDLDAYRRKLELDRAYLEELSFTKDVRILFGTALWMARARGGRSYRQAMANHS